MQLSINTHVREKQSIKTTVSASDSRASSLRWEAAVFHKWLKRPVGQMMRTHSRLQPLIHGFNSNNNSAVHK